MVRLNIELTYLIIIDNQVFQKETVVIFLTKRYIIYKYNRVWINLAQDQVCISAFACILKAKRPLYGGKCKESRIGHCLI